jgi:hypothetical protein
MTRKQQRATARSISRRQVLKATGAATGGLALGTLTGGMSFNSLLDTSSLHIGATSAHAATPANAHFMRVWQRTDLPVAEGISKRTWMWGPQAFTEAVVEPYAESPDGLRTVQYFDKARMEITNPAADQNSIWYVTNGLLVTELITGKMQTGHNSFVNGTPALVNVAGDMDDPDGPTYATFFNLLDAAPLGLNSTIVQRVNRQGNVSSDAALADQGVVVSKIDEVTNHSIAAPFWAFMNSSGTVYENGAYVQDKLFEDPYFATGRPITEPYWTEARVAGTLRLVLVQCFERRCLTYTPGNPEGWQVEAGNVGLHYYNWRYGAAEIPQPEEPQDPEEPHLPEPIAGSCIPMVAGAKEKQDLQQRLEPLLENNEIPSVLAGAIFQMSQRFLLGHNPGNDLERDAFEVFGKLEPETLAILGCAVSTFGMLTSAERNRLVLPETFENVDEPLNQDRLVHLLSQELVQRTSLVAYGDARCADHQHPGQVRLTPTAGSDDVLPPLIRINRVNKLRTITHAPFLTLAEYTSEELEQQCAPDMVDDEVVVNCSIQTSDCPGHSIDGACLRVPAVRPGEAVIVEGVNFFSVDTKVQITAKFPGTITREVDAHVCGDIDTPLTETINGAEVFISDSRVKDLLSFRVPADLPTGIYMFTVMVPNDIEVPGYGDYLMSVHQFIRVLPPNDTTFQITAEQLHCERETSPAWWGSDEVALRFISIPVFAGLVPGNARQIQTPIFKKIDSGDTIELNRVLFQESKIEGLSLVMIGHEVDSVSHYEKEIESLSDSYVEVLSSTWNKLSSAVGAAGGAVALALGLSKAWATAIAAVVALVINFFIALWATADLIIEDAMSFSLTSLAALTSPNEPMPGLDGYRSAGGIDVMVVPLSKGVQYHELRKYYAPKENSEYHIRLRYNMFTPVSPLIPIDEVMLPAEQVVAG